MPLHDISAAAAAAGGLFDAYAYLRDEKAANTFSGTFTSGAWQTRTLNTEVFDPDGIVSLAANQFVLAAGSYLIVAHAPVFQCGRHKLKLRDITNAADLVIGSSQYAGTADVADDAFLYGRITLAATTTLELQHRCATTKATNGFGIESNLAVVEVYAEVMIYRES